MTQEYHGSHEAPSDDGYSNSITALEESFGPDVYEHPEFYGSGECDAETMRQLMAAKDNPDATVRIYRALPAGLHEINSGDWVTLSEAYSKQHAIQDDDEKHDWPIISANVPASSVWTDGNDLAEYGYDGPQLTGLTTIGGSSAEQAHTPTHPTTPAPQSPWSDRTPEYHAASQALIDGTARSLLAAGLAASGMSISTLAALVGHSERIAERVVEGSVLLNEGTVALYFQALGVKPGPAAVEAWEAEQVVLRRIAKHSE